MWINGLVVTLTETAEAEQAVCALASAGPFTLGERFGQQQVVLLQADSEHECRAWHEWAEALPGVACVLVAFASNEDALALSGMAAAKETDHVQW